MAKEQHTDNKMANKNQIWWYMKHKAMSISFMYEPFFIGLSFPFVRSFVCALYHSFFPFSIDMCTTFEDRLCSQFFPFFCFVLVFLLPIRCKKNAIFIMLCYHILTITHGHTHFFAYVHIQSSFHMSTTFRQIHWQEINNLCVLILSNFGLRNEKIYFIKKYFYLNIIQQSEWIFEREKTATNL